MAPAPVAAVAAVPAVPAARSISLSVAGGNKKGPDGKLPDSFSKTNFAVKVGQPTRLVINNTDSGPHSIVAAGTGVSITVYPGTHTYEIVATKAGRFEWVCTIPCDTAARGWAMTHPGYMAGYITSGARGPGLIFILPLIDRVRRVSPRIITMPIQSQGIITKDNVSIDVGARLRRDDGAPARAETRQTKAVSDLPAPAVAPAALTNGQLVR